MKKYKLIGITQYGNRHLIIDDLKALEQMVGCTVYESENKAAIDGGRMFIMPEGENVHICFLELEEIINE